MGAFDLECDLPSGREFHNLRYKPHVKENRTPEHDELSEHGHNSLHKFSHRAGWLVVLLMFQSSSSLILQYFEVLIKTHPVVIYFLTMLVGAGGNAGSQSTVLVVRKLAMLNSKLDRDLAWQLFWTEVSVGARLATVLFLASLVRCFVFQVRGYECLAICLSMCAIVFSSTVLGAVLPLLLNKLRLDPAHAGATIQVVMDISGVLITCVVSCTVLGIRPSAVDGGTGHAQKVI